ncbi:FtsX-like permease family protein [Streptomyces scopuliridis]|uniref:ABC transporter permease n=1 Tax=Streptomyces scopuliridis RB72 TaxID=1440053 RepID=A0A2T7SRG5_9ACTN|nr:ABC transporter permease [Streptomyces scopuliridis]PVE05466.1 ABC transporter permease [Streptomyces scopuliridis RB72]
MLSVALRTLRSRWTSFVGSFIALSLGVGLIATMGLALAASLDAPERRPERFAGARVVVKGADTLRVPTRIGDRVAKLDSPRPVPPSLARELAALGRSVEDRTFAVRAEGGPAGLVGHPWSTAAFAPYRLDTGRAPRAADEAVVTGDWTAPGRRVRTDRGTLTIVGTVRDLGFERALFYTDDRASQLSPRVDQLVVDADPRAVREKVAGSADAAGVRVLTGPGRKDADADPERDSEALVAVNAMLGTAAGVTGFVSVFVVASTFAFAVAQRRREFGLLRTAGATPGQIRRMVLAEAMVVGVVASAAGCALGARGAPLLAAWLVDGGLAPRWFAIGSYTWPYQLAFWSGLFVALSGAVAASRRAGRTGPVEALRDAAVDTGTMTRGRWFLGAGLLLTGIGLPVHALLTEPGGLLGRKSYTSGPMPLIVACALLAPVLVPPLARLLAWLPARLPGATGLLVRENAAAGVRRTAAVAAPVLVTVALTGSLLGATATIDEAKAHEIRQRTTADFVISGPGREAATEGGAGGSGAGGSGFDAATVERIRRVPGAVVSPTAASAVHVLEDGVALIRSDTRAADPAALAATARLPLAAGRVTDLDDRSIIVTEEWERHTVGESVDIWRADGTRASLRIAAVMRIGTGDNGAYVTPRNAPGAPVDRIEVKLAEGADASAVAAGLRAAAGRSGGQVFTKDAWVAASYPETDGRTRTGFLLVLGIALLYTGISLANTLVMAGSDRVRELAALRLAGATAPQMLRLVAAEALLVVAVGAVLGTLVAGVGLGGLRGALSVLHAGSPLVLPWNALGAAAGACAVLATVSAVIPAALSLRRRPVEFAGTRE